MPDAVRVCAATDVADGAARRFDVGGHRVAIVRIGDAYYAIGDRCSHEDYSLAEGEVFADELELECYQHGSTFSLVSGEPQALPATKAVPVFEVRVDGDDLIMEVG